MSYLQVYGELLVRTNRWDPAVLERFEADEVVATMARRPRPRLGRGGIPRLSGARVNASLPGRTVVC